MRFVKESFIRATPETVFSFHDRPDALMRLTPPWEKTRIVKTASIANVGSRAEIKHQVGPFGLTWIAQHTLYEPPRMFEDVQIKGPFRSWRHRHIVEDASGGSLLRDEIEYEPPMGFVGRWLAPLIIEKRLQKLFDYRHEVTRAWCERSEKSST